MNQAGSTLPSSIRSAALQALNLRSFLPATGSSGFGVAGSQGTGKGRMEQPPHDGVHVLVGGDDGLMSDPRTAARDPIFWLHHCNVDRLWEVWLRKGGGRANPTRNQWLDETFPRLFDESGNSAPVLKVSQLQKTNDLGYTYDKLTDPPGAAAAVATGADSVAEPVKTEVAATVEKTRITSAPKSIELSGDKVKEITSKAGATSATGDEKKILLRLQGVSVDRPTGSIYEVYLNLPSAPEEASSTSPHFIGVVTLFGSAPSGKELRADTHTHRATPGVVGEEFLFDVTKVLRTLARQGSVDLSKLKVTVLPRGTLVEGKPRKVETKATVSIDKITLETAEPQPAR
jgi:tyrosinase